MQKKYYSEQLKNCQNNVKKTWNVMKTVVNENKSCVTQGIFRLSNGSFTTDKQLIRLGKFVYKSFNKRAEN